MGIATDLIDYWRQLASDRVFWERHWTDIATYALPDVEPYNSMFTGGMATQAIDSVVSAPVAAQRSRAVYDQTSLWAIDRGTAGFMSLVTPQSEKWHGVKLTDPFATEPSDEEKLYLERLRDYMHLYRGNPQTGFWVAQKAGMRSLWGLGTGVIFVEEAPGQNAAVPMFYRHVPLSENYMATNFAGMVDTNVRLFRRSARAVHAKWGDRCSTRVKTMAQSTTDKNRTVAILHFVMPRSEAMARSSAKVDGDGMDRPGVLGSGFASYYVELDDAHLIGESGFYSFPYVVHHWNRSTDGPYSEGPLALALADVKSLNLLAKNTLMAASQAVNPPMAWANDGVERLDLNPGGRNPGMVSRDGKPLAVPLITGARPDFAEAVMEAKRNQLREGLYVNLWQTIINNPEMTATQAMLAANEKGELLGPAGNSVQTGLSLQFDREIDILGRKGAFSDGSPLVPPETLSGRNLGLRFSSPLDRLQRAAEFVGMQRLMEFVSVIAQAKPEILDRLDVDEMVEIAADILAAPVKTLVTRQKADQIRQTMQQMKAAAAAGQGAQVIGDGMKAVGEGADAMSGPGVSNILKMIQGGGGQPRAEAA